MKAIAKHDCTVGLWIDLNSLSLNRMEVKKGDVLEFPIHEDKELTGIISEKLGKRCITFKDGMHYIPTYSRDFEYIKD